MHQRKPVVTYRRKKLASAIGTTLSLLAVGALMLDAPAYAQPAGDPESSNAKQQPASTSSGRKPDAAEEGDEGAEEEEIPFVTEAEEIVEEVVVRGTRARLESSQDLKQMSEVILDSITAEDIGALPDRSVTETLQRVPGVAINRFAAGRDPDHFSVEGSGVVVRGLTYVRSEVNGRDAFTANNGRGLSFADVPPELLGGVDVIKSPSADRVEGGIAGIVNLRTRRPFDNPDPILAFSLEGNHGDFIEESTPAGSALGSYRWNTDVGEFGVLGSVVYSQIKSRADRFQVSNFAERTLYSTGDVVPTGAPGETEMQQVFFPRGAVVGTQDFDRERYGYSAAVQWRSPDRSMDATFQFLRSDSREAWTERVVEIATDNVANNGDSRAVPGTTFTFDDSGLFDSGFITGPTGWRSDQFTGDPRTPIMGLQSNNIRRDVDQKFVTDDYGLNFRWYPTSTIALNFDYQHVDSTVENLDTSLWVSTYQNAMIDLNGDDIPTVMFTPPILCDGQPANECPTYFQEGNNSFTDPYNSFYRSAMDHIEDSEGTSDAFRVDLDKALENDWLRSVRVGYRFADRDQTARFSTYNWGVLSEQWGNDGPVWLDDPVDAVQGGTGGSAPQGFAPFTFPGFFDGETSNPLGGSGRLFYSQNTAENYADYVAYALQIAQEWQPSGGWVPLAARPGVLEGTPFLPGEINPVEEQNDAAYVMFNFDKVLDNGWELAGNVGVRYTQTTREAGGFQSFNFQNFTSEEVCLEQITSGQVSAFCGLPIEVRNDARAFSNGALIPIVADLDYDHFLPSLNLRLRVTEDVQFRAAYFKGVAPPDFGLTRAFYNINLQTNPDDIEAGGGRPIGRFNAGNPFLEPVEADNLDFTAEWYFSEVGQLSVAFFYKELDGIVTSDIQRQTFTNNGATFEAIVTTPVNSGETGKIKGLELAYQQTYDFLPGWASGFGLTSNYTYVDSSNVPQSTLSETDPDVGAGNQSTVDTSLLPLEGLSKHTFNITPFYEKGRWSARLAYSWRDDFLLTARDVIVPFQPIMHEETGQLDGSIFYSITDNWKIGLQGVNLTQEVIKTSAIINEDLTTAPRSWFVNDRRFTLVVRGHF